MSSWNNFFATEEFNIPNSFGKKKKKKKKESRAKVLKKKSKLKRLLRIKCPICFESKESMSATICGHVFCTGCIQRTLLQKHKCPICRKTLRGNNTFHRLYLDDSNVCELVD